MQDIYDMMWITPLVNFEHLLSIYYLPTLFIGAALLLITTWFIFTQPTTTNNPPPSPPRWPVIGNLHQLKGELIHHSFLSLARRYGDSLMLLYMGSLPCLVVSSSEAAREIMNTHDLTFASRPYRRMFEKLTYSHKEITLAPYGEHWKQAKGIITMHLLSMKKVKSLQGLREKMIADSMSKFTQCFVSKTPVNLSDAFTSFSNDVTCMATFGRTYNDGEIRGNLKRIMKEAFELVVTFFFEEAIPQLAVMDRLRGLKTKFNRVETDLDRFLQDAIDEMRSKKRNNPNPIGEEIDGHGKESFLNALLNIQKEESTHSINTEDIKALLLDAYAGGTDTTASLLEWTMTELLLHPKSLKKVQDEIKTVLNGKNDIEDEDLENMKYLKAVIMEATRLHPAIPIMLPREARHDVQVMGYDIAKGTRVLVNIYAIMRDPKVFDQPDLFVPERFLESSIDFVRHDFKLLVFGAGRRGCPGRMFAMANAEKMLANMLYRFDWFLPEGVRAEDVDMSESFGVANHRRVPLLAVGKPVPYIVS